MSQLGLAMTFYDNRTFKNILKQSFYAGQKPTTSPAFNYMNKGETDCTGYTGHKHLSQNLQIFQMSKAEVALTRTRCQLESV